MYSLIYIAIGGAIGGVARVAIGEALTARAGDKIPWGTLTVNLSGALLIGVVYSAVASQELWQFLAWGVLGSFTTVSAFSLQTLQLMQQRRVLSAAFYVVGSVSGCLFMAWIGMMLA